MRKFLLATTTVIALASPALARPVDNPAMVQNVFTSVPSRGVRTMPSMSIPRRAHMTSSSARMLSLLCSTSKTMPMWRRSGARTTAEFSC